MFRQHSESATVVVDVPRPLFTAQNTTVSSAVTAQHSARTPSFGMRSPPVVECMCSTAVRRGQREGKPERQGDSGSTRRSVGQFTQTSQCLAMMAYSVMKEKSK